MEYLESRLLLTVSESIIEWCRYADDIFAIVPDNLNMNEFLVKLNDFNPNIQFTLEIENNGKLPFLDVLLIRNSSHNLDFKVYRKPTHSNTYIHAFSKHSFKIKLATISNIFLRAYNICSNIYIDEEIDYIFKSFNRLGYNYRTISNAHFKARKSYFKVNANSNSNSNSINYLVLPFLENSSDINNIAKYFNISIVNKSNTTLKSILKNNCRSSNDESGAIYQIKCGSCDSCYIKRPVYQHKYALRNVDTNNAVVKHIVEENHRVVVDDATVIVKENDTRKRKLIESVLIQSTNNFNINQINLNTDKFTNIILNSFSSRIKKTLDELKENGTLVKTGVT